MKKLFFLLTGMILTGISYSLDNFKQLELYEGFEYSTEIKEDIQLSSDEKNEQKKEMQNVMSAKCTTTHTSLFFSLKSNEKQLFSSINKGIAIHLNSIPVSYQIHTYAGNITYSGAASRLKSPKLTFSSALKKFSVMKPGLEPSLPTRSSSNKTDSICIKLNPDKKLPANTINLPQIEVAYINNGTILASTSMKYSTKKIPLLQTGITAGVFTNGKGTTSWFDKIPRFQNKYYPAAELSVSAVTQTIRASCTAGINKTPFDTSSLFHRTSFYTRIQTSFIAGLFSLSSDIFASSSAFITADGTFCHTPFQFSLNPQKIFSLKDYIFRVGLLGAVTFETESFFSNSLCPSYKLRADLSVIKNHISFVLYTVYTNSREETASSAEQTLSFSGRISVRKEKHSYAVKGTASFTGLNTFSGSQNYSASANIYFNEGMISSLAAAVSVKVKDSSFSKGSFSLDLVLKDRNRTKTKKEENPFRKLKFTVKTGISLTF